MATSQPAEDRPASPRTALRPRATTTSNGSARFAGCRSTRANPRIGQLCRRALIGAGGSDLVDLSTATVPRARSGRGGNLTAYLNRLPIGDQPWTLTQVNTLLFLRFLHLTGRFGPSDGNPLEIMNGV